MEINYHFLDCGPDFEYHDKRRSVFQDIYAEMLSRESSLKGKVLDVGCGHGHNPVISKLIHLIGELDGVDPFPVVEPHPNIKNRWTCRMEDIPVKPNTYDMAYSYNVVEHISDENAFLSKIMEILKPGGIYWSMSPNARHPFTWGVRLLQAMKLKDIYNNKVKTKGNNYPAYYRLCSDMKVLKGVKNQSLPVSKLDFFYIQNVQWDTFFPENLRFVPHIVDRFVILHKPRMSNIFMFRAQKRQ